MDVATVKDNKRKAEEEAPAAKKVKLDSGKAAPVAAAAGEGESDTLFVGNMSWNSSEDTLREFFSGCGEILNIRMGAQPAAAAAAAAAPGAAWVLRR
jgi:nucleolin